MIDDFKRVSVVDDMAVQAYITLRNAMLAMRGVYQDTADSVRKTILEMDNNADTKAYLEGVAKTFTKVASDIDELLNTKGGKKNDKV